MCAHSASLLWTRCFQFCGRFRRAWFLCLAPPSKEAHQKVVFLPASFPSFRKAMALLCTFSNSHWTSKLLHTGRWRWVRLRLGVRTCEGHRHWEKSSQSCKDTWLMTSVRLHPALVCRTRGACGGAEDWTESEEMWVGWGVETFQRTCGGRRTDGCKHCHHQQSLPPNPFLYPPKHSENGYFKNYLMWVQCVLSS